MERLGAFKRFISAYYILHLLGFGAYFLLRQSVAWDAAGASQPRGYLKSPDQLQYWEMRAFWVLSALAGSRFWLRATLDTYLAELFNYLKLSAVILLGSVDARLGGALLLLYLLIFLLVSQPRYDGPQQVDVLTPASLQSHVLSAQNTGTWFVMCTTIWSSACWQAQATFAELSLQYASDRLKFGEIDVGRWPKIAKKFDICIESIPFQLPSFLLFKNGKLVKRLPGRDESWSSKGKLRDRLVKEFDLDMLLAAALKNS